MASVPESRNLLFGRAQYVSAATVCICFLVAACGKKPVSRPPESRPSDAHVEVPTVVASLPGSSLSFVRQMGARLDALPANAGLEARMEAASIAREVGDLWRRESLLRLILKQQPDDQRVQFLLAETLERLMRLREAKSLYLKLLAANPKRVEPYLGLASTAMELDGRAAAWKWLEQGVKACSDDIRSLLQLAGRYREWDDLPAASSLLSRALKREPTNSSLSFQRATVLLQMGKTKEGRDGLENLLLRESVHAGAHVALATSILSEAESISDLEAARAHAERAATLNAANPDAHWVSAAIYRRLGLLRLAARSYVQSLALNPADPQSRFGLAQVYGELGMADLASRQMAIYKDAAARIRSRKLDVARTSKDGSRPNMHLELAREAERIGNYAVAVREAQTAVGLGASDSEARRYLALLYSRLDWGRPPAGPRG